MRSPSIDSLPIELGKHRILATRQACEFVGVSIPQWRRLRRDGEAPPGIMLGTRRQGWTIGTLIAWLESRQQPRAAA